MCPHGGLEQRQINMSQAFTSNGSSVGQFCTFVANYDPSPVILPAGILITLSLKQLSSCSLKHFHVKQFTCLNIS